MNMISSALFTDFYELTMAQGYWKENMEEALLMMRSKAADLIKPVVYID